MSRSLPRPVRALGRRIVACGCLWVCLSAALAVVPATAIAIGPRTELQTAAAKGRSGRVSELLAAGAAVDADDGRGATALGWAVRNGNLDTARLLLDAGADPDAGVRPQRSPIALAVAHEQQAMVGLLLERGSRAMTNPELAAAVLTSLGESANPGLVQMLVPPMTGLISQSQSLCAAAADVIADGTPDFSSLFLRALGPARKEPMFRAALLARAADLGRRDVAEAALEAGADVNGHDADGLTPLFHAVRGKRSAFVLWLLQQGSDPNGGDPAAGSPLALAVAGGDGAVAALLLSAGADYAGAGLDPARLSAMVGDRVIDPREVALLEKVGAVNARDDRGRTLLFRAADRGDVLGVALLLRHHADPAATVVRWPADRGWTPLMAAAARGHAAVVEQLLAAGAPVDQRNGEGRTALLFAAWYGRGGIVEALLAAGADPDAVDSVGQSAVLAAVANGDEASIRALRVRSAYPLPISPAPVRR